MRMKTRYWSVEMARVTRACSATWLFSLVLWDLFAGGNRIADCESLLLAEGDSIEKGA